MYSLPHKTQDNCLAMFLICSVTSELSNPLKMNFTLKLNEESSAIPNNGVIYGVIN